MLYRIWFGRMWITEEHTAANGKEAVVDQVIRAFLANWYKRLALS